MPTSVVDQFFSLDPANPPPVGSNVAVTSRFLTDQNDDGDIDEFDNDAVSGVDVTASWPGDTVTINVEGTGDVTYFGTTLYLSDGAIIFTPTDDQVLKEGEFVSSTFVTVQGPLLLSELGPSCFTPDTLIATPRGPIQVQELETGDLITTVDHGPIPLLAIRKRTVSLEHLSKHARHAPICIPANTFGENLPSKTLRVSPQHRLLLASKIVLRMYRETEILAPASKLVGYFGISRERPTANIEYIHLLFSHHAIVLSNDLPSESLFMGSNASRSLNRLEAMEYCSLLGKHINSKMEPARTFASGRKLMRLLERHAKAQISLLESWRTKGQRTFQQYTSS